MKEEKTTLMVETNGPIELRLMPNELLTFLAASLDLEITEMYKSKIKRKKKREEKKSKQSS